MSAVGGMGLEDGGSEGGKLYRPGDGDERDGNAVAC